jgi:integrase
MPASPQPRRRRRRAEATGTVRVAWRAKGPMWVMKYRLPDGTESMKVLGPAWVKRDPDDPRGWLARRGRPPAGTLGEDAATASLRAFLDQQTERTPPERVSFARCAQGFLERCEDKQRSPNTLRTYRQIVAEVNERWDGWRIVDVDADELEDYRDELAERGLAASTLNQRRAVLSGIFKLARRRFRVAVDPLDGFERAEVKAAGDLEVYSVEEVWALVRAAGSLTDAAIFLIAALCGLRRSEILGLRWRAVLFDQRALLLRRAYTDLGGDRLPKGQHVHSVPMAPQVYELLARLAPAELDPDARVFPGEKGDAMDASALYRRYVKAQQRAGIRRLRFHDLRHTFGTQAIASGAHVMDVKDWMGHRHLSTTMRYVHHQPRHEAAQRLGRHFSGVAAELDTLLGDPTRVRVGEKPAAADDSRRLRNTPEDASSG